MHIEVENHLLHLVDIDDLVCVIKIAFIIVQSSFVKQNCDVMTRINWKMQTYRTR